MTGSLPNRSRKRPVIFSNPERRFDEGRYRQAGAFTGGVVRGRAGAVRTLGYFTPDAKDTVPDKPVFNRIVGLRDSWAKIANK